MKYKFKKNNNKDNKIAKIFYIFTINCEIN